MTALTASQRRALLALAQPTAAGHRDAGVTAIATHHSSPEIVRHTTIDALIARKLVTWRQLYPGVWRFYLTETGVEIAAQIATAPTVTRRSRTIVCGTCDHRYDSVRYTRCPACNG